MLVMFIVLIAGPLIARRYLTGLPSIPMDLVQPTGQDNNDTSSSETGTALLGGATDTAGSRARLF
jgi:1,3-beta-glucan synthase